MFLLILFIYSRSEATFFGNPTTVFSGYGGSVYRSSASAGQGCFCLEGIKGYGGYSGSRESGRFFYHLYCIVMSHIVSKGVFFSESAMYFFDLKIKKKIFQKTILSLKFKFPANNTLLLLAGNLIFKLRIVFWNSFFLRFGDLKKLHRTFWKKATFRRRANLGEVSTYSNFWVKMKNITRNSEYTFGALVAQIIVLVSSFPSKKKKKIDENLLIENWE